MKSKKQDSSQKQVGKICKVYHGSRPWLEELYNDSSDTSQTAVLKTFRAAAAAQQEKQQNMKQKEASRCSQQQV